MWMFIEARKAVFNFSIFMTTIAVVFFCHGEPTLTSIPVPWVISNLTGVDDSVGNIKSPNITTIKTINRIIPIPRNFLFTITITYGEGKLHDKDIGPDGIRQALQNPPPIEAEAWDNVQRYR